MALRVAFRKRTPDGLSIDIEDFEGCPVLLLTKEKPGTHQRCAQVMGIAGRELNTPTVTWYYEFEPLPKSISMPRLIRYLEGNAYAVGIFDQFGNFRTKPIASWS